jgi:hypothetical protein
MPIYRDMADLDFHLEATFRVAPHQDGTFSVVVQIPDSHPTTVTTFATSSDAEHWIERYKARVAEKPRLKWRGGRP